MAGARLSSVARIAARAWWLPLVPIGFVTDRGSRWRWLLLPGIVTVTAMASSGGKLIVGRPRPGAEHQVAPRGRLGAASFPSTHSACAFAIAGWLRCSRQRGWLHVVAIGIAYSRVRRRAHHPSDVIAGAALGYGIAWRIDSLRSGLVLPRAVSPAASSGSGAGR